MTQETNNNFWQVWNEFPWPDPKPISYRLYHDEQGHPLAYSMEDLDGDYIEVDAKTYALAPYNVLVRNGQLIEIKPKLTIEKLTPGDSGVSCHPWDVCVIDDREPNIKWNFKSYEQD